MQQRAELIGASFSVSSRRSSGTVVTVTWPLPVGTSS
jgi:signal transduction histidine kinase